MYKFKKYVFSNQIKILRGVWEAFSKEIRLNVSKIFIETRCLLVPIPLLNLSIHSYLVEKNSMHPRFSTMYIFPFY